MVMLAMHYCFTLPERALEALPEVGVPREGGVVGGWCSLDNARSGRLATPTSSPRVAGSREAKLLKGGETRGAANRGFF